MSSISRKTKVKAKMIDMGIVPAFTGKELKEMLISLPEEERRIAQRKFRKLWRKIAKNDRALREILISNGNPDVNTLRTRSCVVVSSVMNNIGDD
jgi:formyltetrahydrofolate synthetase